MSDVINLWTKPVFRLYFWGVSICKIKPTFRSSEGTCGPGQLVLSCWQHRLSLHKPASKESQKQQQQPPSKQPTNHVCNQHNGRSTPTCVFKYITGEGQPKQSIEAAFIELSAAGNVCLRTGVFLQYYFYGILRIPRGQCGSPPKTAHQAPTQAAKARQNRQELRSSLCGAQLPRPRARLGGGRGATTRDGRRPPSPTRGRLRCVSHQASRCVGAGRSRWLGPCHLVAGSWALLFDPQSKGIRGSCHAQVSPVFNYIVWNPEF